MEVAGDWLPKNPLPAMPVLEINLISAQGLKFPSNHFYPKQTYAVASVDSSHRLRTRIDLTGAENPSWYEKLLFRVSPQFLARETSAVSIQIYAVGRLSDSLLGTVRFLIGNLIASNDCTKSPAFTAVQVRRPSGRFQGVLNIALMVNENPDFAASLNGASAIGYRDLMGENYSSRKLWKKSKSEISVASLDTTESPDLSDGSESPCSSSSSSSAKSNVLRDLNRVRNFGATKTLKPSSSSGFLCGLVMQRKSTTAAIDRSSSEKSLKVSRPSPDSER